MFAFSSQFSKKKLQEKYPTKTSVDVQLAQFVGRLFLVLGVFVFVALSVDIYHFTH